MKVDSVQSDVFSCNGFVAAVALLANALLADRFALHVEGFCRDNVDNRIASTATEAINTTCRIVHLQEFVIENFATPEALPARKELTKDVGD